MIRVFGINDKIYRSNGDAVIQATKARVFNSDNGDFYLTLNCGIEYNDYIQPNNIIVVPTPQGDQAFRIRSVTKNKNRLEVKAWHVFYDTLNYVIVDEYANNVTCEEALTLFNDSTDNYSPFTVYSDIETQRQYRCVRTSFNECIQTIIERWGGHLKRDNWNISILSEIGQDNGITIQYKKNLQDLTASYDWSSVCTKLLPVGFDGILLEELYLYSEIQYDIPYTKVVSFEQDIDREDYEDDESYFSALRADLRAQGEAYLQNYCYPIVNYTLKGMPEKVTDIGDTIKVIDERIGVDILTEVISYEYDCITEKYVSLEFGNFTNTLSDLIANISGATSNQINIASTAMNTELNTLIDAENKRINGLLFFKVGDAIEIKKQVVDGYITGSSTKLVFTIPLPKNCENVAPYLTLLRVNVRKVSGGYVFNHSAEGFNLMDAVGILVTTVKGADFLTVTATSGSALSVTDNTPVSVCVETAQIAFN